VEAARGGAHQQPVPRSDGPTAEEGDAQLDAALSAVHAALAESAVETVVPGTSAGATILDALAEGGQQARAEVAAAIDTAAGTVHAGATDVTRGLAETETDEVAAVAAADREATGAVVSSIEQAESTVTGHAREQGAEVGTWSTTASRAGEEGVAEEANRVREAGHAQTRQTAAAGVETGETAAAAMRQAAAETAAGTSSGRGGDVAQAYDQVDSRISEDTAAQMRGAAMQARIGMRTHAAEAASTVLRTSEQVAATVAQEATVLRRRVAATAQRSGAVLAQTAGLAGRQLGQAGTTAVRQLASAAATGRQALHVRADETRGVISTAAARMVSKLAGQARRTMASSRRSQAAAARRLRGVRLNPAAAASTAGGARQQMLQSHAGARGQAAAVATAGTAALGLAGGELSGALRGLGADQRAGLAEGGSRAESGARRLAGATGRALGGITEQARAVGDGVVAATKRGLGTAAALAGTGLAQATSAVRAHLAERQSDVAARTSDAAADTRERVGQGQQRLDQQMSGGAAVQRGILGDIVDWVGDQLSDLFDLLSNPGFWVGLLVTVVLFPVMGPGALVVGGAAGGLVSGIHDNVKNGRPWYEPHTLIKHVAIGTFAGAAFAFGGGFLVGLGLEGGAVLGGTMALSAGIGIGVNVATGERWDKGLLANLFLGWLFHKLAGPKGGEGEGQGRGRGRTGGEDESPPPAGRPVLAGRAAVQARAEALIARILRMRDRHEATGQPDPAVQARLRAEEANARSLARKAEEAMTEQDMRTVARDLKAAEKGAYDASVAVGRVQVNQLLQALTRRIAALRERIPENVAQNRRGQLAQLRAQLDQLARARDALERDVAAANSERQIDAAGARAQKLGRDLDAWESSHDKLLRPSEAAILGISPEAAEALRVIEEKAYDPLGDYNRGEGGRKTNHYDAARREAAGERVGPADPNEPPFDHIRDLQNAREAVANARGTLENEAANPRPNITERGIRVILEKMEAAAGLLRRVDEFLSSIGWPASRPHEWVQENGRWVGQGDPAVIRPRLTGRVARARATAEGLDRAILRDVDPARQPALQAERQAVMNDADALAARLQAAQNEAALVAERPAIEQLETRAAALQSDVNQVPAGGQ
jgi:hypothetical protein